MNYTFKDITGQVFNRLTVVEKLPERKDGKIVWKCVCICGNITKTSGDSLRNGKTKSCGCLRSELIAAANKKESGLASFNRLYYKYKCGAESKNHVFELTKEQFRYITSSSCHYCGIEPCKEQKRTDNNMNGFYVYNGVDRKDNAKGYTIENSLPCCTICNFMKLDMAYSEFIEWLNRVAKYRTAVERNNK